MKQPASHCRPSVYQAAGIDEQAVRPASSFLQIMNPIQRDQLESSIKQKT
jgi:hypothetical protein